MCLGVWSNLGWMTDIKAVSIRLPEVPADEEEEELGIGWDALI